MSEQELKKCPACGGEAEIDQFSGMSTNRVVICKECGLMTLEDNLTEEQAIKAWNNQPRIEQLKQRNKELEQAYTVLALKISQYLNGNLSVSAEDIKKEWKRGEQLLKGKSDE